MSEKLLPFSTIIIFTTKRPKLLKRSLHYYAQYNGSVIIADGSVEPYSGTIPANTLYLHLPKMSIAKRINHALNYSKTKYSIFSSDDDFLSFKGLEVGEQFLENNKDYSSVQGCYINFDSKFPNLLYGPMYTHFLNHDNNADIVKHRFKEAFFVTHIYSLMPTKMMQKIFSLLLIKDIQAELEVVCTIGCAALGKCRVLPVFWMARDAGRYFNDPEVNEENDEIKPVNWQKFILTNSGHAFVNNLKSLCIEKNMSVDFEASNINEAFELKEIIGSNISKKLFWKTRIHKTLKMCLPNFLITLAQAFTCLRRRRKQNSLPGYPWTDNIASAEWAKIKLNIYDVTHSK